MRRAPPERRCATLAEALASRGIVIMPKSSNGLAVAAQPSSSAAARDHQRSSSSALDAGMAAAQRVARAELEPVPPGTEISTRRLEGYHHMGVYIGNGEVVHIQGDPWYEHPVEMLVDGRISAKVVRTSVAVFAQVGAHWDFNPLTHTCQHFASEVVCGREISPEGDLIASLWHAAVEEERLASRFGAPLARL